MKSIKAPKVIVPRIGKENMPCDGNYLCETNLCVEQKCKLDPKADVTPVYDYRALNAALWQIADTRFKGKPRKADTYQALLMADPSVPYGTLISVISAMRCKMPEFGKMPQPCYLPTDDENLKKAANPVDDVGLLYDTARADYDPDKMALFHDILFSGGFQ